jgi:hypothetical protein
MEVTLGGKTCRASRITPAPNPTRLQRATLAAWLKRPAGFLRLSYRAEPGRGIPRILGVCREASHRTRQYVPA